MQRYIFVVLIFCFAGESHVFGQRNFLDNLGQQLEQRIQQDLGQHTQNPQQGGEKPTYNSRSLPSESGNKSGGGGNVFDPSQGRDFMLPGDGGTPRYPQYQPEMQHRHGDLHYPGNHIQQTYPQLNQGQVYSQPQNSSIHGVTYSGGQDIPTSPEMSSQFISIRCPESAVGSIYYTLTSNRGTFGFSMSAGQEQRFRLGSGWTISYDNGVEKKRYRLEGGKRYLLKPNEANQWQILAAR